MQLSHRLEALHNISSSSNNTRRSQQQQVQGQGQQQGSASTSAPASSAVQSQPGAGPGAGAAAAAAAAGARVPLHGDPLTDLPFLCFANVGEPVPEPWQEQVGGAGSETGRG